MTDLKNRFTAEADKVISVDDTSKKPKKSRRKGGKKKKQEETKVETTE